VEEIEAEIRNLEARHRAAVEQAEDAEAEQRRAKAKEELVRNKERQRRSGERNWLKSCSVGASSCPYSPKLVEEVLSEDHALVCCKRFENSSSFEGGRATSQRRALGSGSVPLVRPSGGGVV
jgi:hypothetical protein